MLSGAMFPPSSGHRWLTVLTALDPMTYVVSAVRRGFHGTALPLDLIPVQSSMLTDLAIVAGFAAVTLAAAVALCRRRA
jgi:ABC-type polysaccharide/polyol phosphate export permease